MPLHQLESLALPFESYQLAYTPDPYCRYFWNKGKCRSDGWKVNSPIARAMTTGGFVREPLSLLKERKQQYDAQNRFYMPISYTDPYGAKTKVKYYSNYFLFIEETEDALGNKASVEPF